MIIFKRAADLHNYLSTRRTDHLIGFVPTMGALHEGHASLLQKAKRECGITVCSIFINPTQFNDKNDFDKYPVTIEKDLMLLETSNIDIVFLPSVHEIYPDGLDGNKAYDLGSLESLLEGAHRPGHFQGVCQVVDRLLTMVQPSKLYLGQKDFQQCMVIAKLIELKSHKVELVIAPTVREADGLALSSRNARLSTSARQKAIILFKTLSRIKADIRSEPFDLLIRTGEQSITDAGFEKIDYLAICDPSTLQPASHFKKNHSYVILVAAFIDSVRLIDNIVIDEKSG